MKSQALLVFFVLQLISIIIFFIVLITLLSMTKNVIYHINEFDENTAFLLAVRRLVSTRDCLAYEDKEFIVTEDGKVFFGGRVHPNVIDLNKLKDFEYVNCMRKDLYDREKDVRSGVWDAEKGSGAVFKYEIIPIDLSGDQLDFIYPEWESHMATSMLGRIKKKVMVCYDFNIAPESPCDRGGPATEEQDIWGWGTKVENKICVYSTNYWKEFKNVFVSIGAALSLTIPPCIDTLEEHNETYDCGSVEQLNGTWYKGVGVNSEKACDPEGLFPIWAIGSPKYTFNDNGTVYAAPYKNGYNITLWQQNETTCSGKKAKRTVIPVMIMDNGNLKPGALLIQTCVLRGEKHKGITLPEIIYKPKWLGK